MNTSTFCPRLTRRIASVASLLLAAAFLAGPLSAADFYWSGNSGGSWNIDQTGNWFSGTIPSSGDNLYFNNTGGSCGASGIKTPWCNYAAGAWFGNLITYACSGGITWEGDQTYLYKFENQDTTTLQSLAFLANRTGPDTALQINPVNGPIIVTNVIMQNAQQIQIYGGNTLTVNGVISEIGTAGSTLVILQGATVVLQQAATYTGDTFANSGTLRLSANNALANSGNYLRLGDAANALSANLNLDGGLGLATPINVRSGNSGTMIIANTSGTAGAATYSGNMYLDHDVTVFANSTGGNVLSGTAIDLKNQTLTMDGTGTNLISGVLTNSTGSGKLTKNGTGMLTINGVNNYTGGTTLANGGITINNGSALGTGALTITETGGLTNFLTVATNAAVTLSNNIILPNSTGNYVLVKNQTGKLTLPGTISGGGSGIALRTTTDTTGDKTTVFDFAGTNTFAGGVQLFRGVVQVDNPASLGVGTVYMDANNSPIGDLSFANAMTFTNPMVLQSTASISNAPAVTLSGPISGSGIALGKYGTGVLSLSGANSYNNTATIYAGTLQALTAGTLPTASSVGFGGVSTSPQTLDLQGTAQTLANLVFGTTGTNSVIITGTSGSSLNVSPATLTFAPFATSNSLTVNMSGLSTFIYTNNNGTIQANNGSTLVTASGATVVSLASTNFITATNLTLGNTSPSGSTIITTLKLGQANTINASSITLGSGRAGGTLQFASGLTSPTVTIAGVPGGAATASFSFGAHDSFQPSDSPVDLFDTTAGTLTAQLSSMFIGRTTPTANSTGRGITITDSFKMGAGTLTATSLTMGQINNSGNVTNDTVNITSLFSITNGGTATIPTFTLGSITLTNTGGTTNTLAVTNTIALTNGATLFATTISQGTTNIGAALVNQINWGDGTITNIAGSGLTITNAAVVLNGTTTTHNLGIASGQSGSVGNIISGAGAINLTGLGSETFYGANTYSGATTIGGGTLTLGGAGSMGGGTYAGVITNNGSLVHNSTASVTLSGIISGTGSLTKQTGAGELTLAAANTYTGGTTLAGSTTRVKSNNGNFSTGLVTVSGNATLATQTGGVAVSLTNTVSINSGVTLSIDSGYFNLTFAGPITNSGNFATTSSGTTTLNGTNTYTGTTADGASAILTIGGTGSLGAGLYTNTIAIGNTVNFNSTTAQTLGGAISGAGAGGLNVGAGTVTLTNANNNYTAPTFINAGTLALTGVGAIASTPRINLASGGVFDVSGLTSTFALGAAQTLTGGRTNAAATDINGNYTSAGTNNIAGSGTNGVLTINGNLSLTGGALFYDLLTPAASDLITLNGAGKTLSLSGTTVVTAVLGAQITNGTYTLITNISSIASGTAANLALAVSATNTMRAPTATFAAVAPTVTLTLATGGTNLIWQGNASSAWDINTTANWTNRPGGISDKFFNQDTVNFDDTAAATSNGTNVVLASTVYPAAVTFNNSSKVITIGGAGGIAGGGILTKSGTALVVISNANSYVGGTVVNAGTLRLATNNPNGLGTGTLTMTGGTLDMNSNSISILSLNGTAGTITDGYTNGGAAVTKTLTVNQVVSNTFAGTINNGNSNSVALVKNGAGYLLLSGSGTYTGATTVNAGTLEIQGHSGAEGSITVAQGATLKYGYSTVGSGGYGQSVTINGNGVSDPAGMYILGGKTFNGNTLTLQTQPTTLRAYGSGAATFKGFDNNGTHLSVVASASGSVIDPLVGISAQGYGFTMNVASGANTATGDLLVGSVMSGSASGTKGILVNIFKYGAGSVVLTNASTYANGLLVSAGSVILSGGNNRLPAASGVSLGDGSTGNGLLVLNGVSQTLTNIIVYGTGTGSAIVGGSATASTLTINAPGLVTYAGGIGGTGANQNNLALTKTGVGQLTLSGKLTYTNNTTISAGTVWASSLTNVDGATLSVVDVAGSLAATNLTLGTSAGSTVAITGFASATAAPIVATNLVANGVTTITLAGAFTSGQYPLIQFLSGTIGGTGSFAVQQTGLPRGVTAAIVTNVPNNSIDVVLSANPLLWVGATNGVNVATWDNGTTTNWTLIGLPNYFTNNDNVQIDDTATGTNLLNLTATVSPFAVLVTNSAKNYTISATGTSALTGGMSLTKQGAGLLTITESNSFSGGVNINGGAVNIQNGYAFNTNTVTVNSGAELELSGGINVAPVTALTLKSTGTNSTGGLRNVGGTNTYGGTITLNAAATRINSDSGILTLTNGITAGANLVTLGGSGTITISTGTVSGSGGLVKDGTGTNIWNLNPNISSGGVTVGNGLFQINNGNFGGTFTPLITINTNGTLLGVPSHATGGGAALVINRGTWLMNNPDYKQNLTMVDGLIGLGPDQSGAGAEARVGFAGSTGSWTWYVSNSIAGSIINARLNTIGAGVNLTLNVARGAAASDLTVNGAIVNGGTITVAGNGITKFTYATNTYSGATTVSGGTLVVPTSQTGGGAFTNADGTTLGVNITTGNLPMSSLALGSSTGATIQFLNFIGTNAAPVNATNLATAGTVTVVVTNTAARNIALGQWPLIKYTGSIGGAGFGAFTLAPLPRGVVAVLVNNTGNSSVDLNVLANDQITWNGNVVGGVWDTNNTANWKWNGSSTTYQQPPVPGDGVLFDDTATGTTAVVLNQTVTPLVVVFNNSISNYTVSGSGAISGTNSLIKNGTNSVTLSTANTYTGTTTINAGTLNLGANFSPGSAINLSGGNLNLNLGTTLTEGSQVINFNANNGTIGTYGVGANAQINTFDVNSVDINVANGVTGASIASSVNLLTATYGTRIVVGTGSSLTMNGLITGSGIAGGILNEGSMIGADSTAVLFQGTGSLTLTASNNFTAGSSIPVTSIEAGSLILSGGDNRLPVGSAVYLGSTANETGQLILNGVNQTITGLTNVGTSTASAVVGSSATLSTLTVNTVSNSYRFAGILGGTNVNQNNLALTKSGINTLTISGANTYTGNTTISAGTLALGATGSVSNTPNLNLAAGATLDVSAISAFALTSSNTLNAAGTASAATLNGASGGTVSLGSQPVVLTYDGSNPALTIAQGTLVLNGNAFTVNKATPLTAGSYNIVAASSAITSAGTYSVSGTAIGGGTVGTVTVSGNNVVLTIQNTTTTTLILSSGSNPSTYGDALTFQATVSPAPADGETITFNDGVTTIGTGNTTSGVATLVISSLPASGHSITASYPGDASNVASTSSTLSQTVNPKPLTAALAGAVIKTYDGGTNATLVATNYSLPGVLGGDTVTLNNPASGSYDTKNQGAGKTVTVIGLNISGSSVTNYTLTSASAAAAVGVINTAALTVTATGINKAYDGTTNATVTLSDDKVAGDTVTDSYTGASFATATAGTGKAVSVVGIAIGGADAGNYALQNTTASTTANITAGATTVTVTSSANPAGFNASVTFTATLPADATGNVVFLANGTAWITNALASGTNATALATLPRGTNTIEVQYGGDSNYLAATNDLAGGQVITNHPPVANNTSYSRNGSFTWKILVSDLLTNASDVDVDTLTLTGVGVSTNSITLDTTTYPGYVAYYNPSLVDDQFNYTVSDGFGGTNSGVITLTAGSSGGVTGQVNSFTVSGGVANMTFTGIPGYPYNVQRSTDLTTWSTIWTTNAPSNGLFQFNDNSAPTPSAYYRLMW